MIRKMLRRLGLVKSTAVITLGAALASCGIYLLSTAVFGGFVFRGIFHSTLIPILITPPLALVFLNVTIQLDQSERARQESEDRYRTILDTIEDGYYEVDLSGNLVFFNDAMWRMLGYLKSELIGMNYSTFMDSKNAENVRQTFKEVLDTGVASKGFDWRIVKSDGSRRYLDTSVSLIKSPDGSITGYRGIARDCTERRQAEKELAESREKYRQLFNQAPAGIYEIDFIKGKMVSANDALCAYTGYSREELLSMTIYDLLTDESRARFTNRIEDVVAGKDVPETVEYNIRTKDDRMLWVLLNARHFYENGHPKGATVVVQNITERKQAEEENKKLSDQLRQAQKMEAIGTLAGGIAHDFNNILTAIMGYTEVSSMKVKDAGAVAQNLKKTLRACERARDMVQQILAFSRNRQPERQCVNAGSLIEETMRMLRASLPATINIREEINPESGDIEADPIQIQQLVMNLCTNAAHAMSDNGTLTVRLARIHLDETDLAGLSDISPGQFLQIRIGDNGHGMPEEVLNRIFEPYFTTKSRNEGTGLGLSIAQSIVKSHRGTINVSSRVNRGTTFDVYLPVSEKRGSDEESVTDPLSTGNEQILFIDDEENLVEVGRQMLEHLGYRVEGITGSIEALEHFHADPDRFDLVITDMTMPELSGDILAEEMLRLRPDLPIILATGYSRHITRQRAQAIGIRALITKPYTARDLARMVRQVIDAPVVSKASLQN